MYNNRHICPLKIHIKGTKFNRFNMTLNTPGYDCHGLIMKSI